MQQQRRVGPGHHLAEGVELAPGVRGGDLAVDVQQVPADLVGPPGPQRAAVDQAPHAVVQRMRHRHRPRVGVGAAGGHQGLVGHRVGLVAEVPRGVLGQHRRAAAALPQQVLPRAEHQRDLHGQQRLATMRGPVADPLFDALERRAPAEVMHDAAEVPAGSQAVEAGDAAGVGPADRGGASVGRLRGRDRLRHAPADLHRVAVRAVDVPVRAVRRPGNDAGVVERRAEQPRRADRIDAQQDQPALFVGDVQRGQLGAPGREGAVGILADLLALGDLGPREAVPAEVVVRRAANLEPLAVEDDVAPVRPDLAVAEPHRPRAVDQLAAAMDLQGQRVEVRLLGRPGRQAFGGNGDDLIPRGPAGHPERRGGAAAQDLLAADALEHCGDLQPDRRVREVPHRHADRQLAPPHGRPHQRRADHQVGGGSQFQPRRFGQARGGEGRPRPVVQDRQQVRPVRADVAGDGDRRAGPARDGGHVDPVDVDVAEAADVPPGGGGLNVRQPEHHGPASSARRQGEGPLQPGAATVG